MPSGFKYFWDLESDTIFYIFQDTPDAYDKLVKVMSLEMRARPSDRTKTPEEIAQEERERLEHLEVFSKLFVCSSICMLILISCGIPYRCYCG